MEIIKLCADPHCSAIMHYNTKKCHDCGSKTITINVQTYLKKFAWIHFQYDINGNYHYPQYNKQLQLL